jgi:hypothetical protein
MYKPHNKAALEAMMMKPTNNERALTRLKDVAKACAVDALKR